MGSDILGGPGRMIFTRHSVSGGGQTGAESADMRTKDGTKGDLHQNEFGTSGHDDGDAQQTDQGTNDYRPQPTQSYTDDTATKNH